MIQDLPEKEWLAWLRSHRSKIIAIMSRKKQTEPIDEYHVHYQIGETVGD